MSIPNDPVYLGDAVYASFDGYMIELYTHEGMRIYLEPSVMDALQLYSDRLRAEAAEAAEAAADLESFGNGEPLA